ncbi:MAG TPA: hypothetical protein DCS23_01635 [Candidatus Yonathbacteria bacterium]|nr:hypothetical protein [Candidatus Yonathbacteria bacterium]
MNTDRNYILDNDGNYLKIIGNFHPDGKIVSYVKYFPSQYGHKTIEDQKYSFNSIVAKSFVFLKGNPDRVCFSSHHGNIVTCTPIEKVKKIFDCREKLQEILNNKEKYLGHPVGSELIKFLDHIATKVNMGKVGITGSFLVDAFDKNSDIDLVCYGNEATTIMRECFDKFTISYRGEFAMSLYLRRIAHMKPMNFDLLIEQENRKLQGLTQENKIHINCQPLREDENDFFEKLELIDIGEIECIAVIVDDTEGQYAPSVYKIEIIDIIQSLFSSDSNFSSKVQVFISYIGGYANSFRKGDKVYLKGGLVLIRENNKIYYGVELTPWNTDSFHQANLLKKYS